MKNTKIELNEKEMEQVSGGCEPYAINNENNSDNEGIVSCITKYSDTLSLVNKARPCSIGTDFPEPDTIVGMKKSLK